MPSPNSFALSLLLSGFLSTGFLSTQGMSQSIGSGDPGLKVVSGPSGSFAIFKDEPQTFGIGLIGGWKNRNIQLVIDQGYHFDKAFPGDPMQLFPFSEDSAFSCTGGSWAPDFKRWDYSRRKYYGYQLIDCRINIITDVQQEATVKYGLGSGDIFLGFINGTVFYWRNFDPSKIYWRTKDPTKTYYQALPTWVIDLYGAAHGIKKDIALLAFGKSHGLFHYAPYTHEVIELKLAKGTECVP